MQRLIGKVAIVTGASVGIGRETAKLFAREGAKLVVAARRESELETLTSEIVGEGGNAEYLAGDVRSEDFAKALVALAVNCFGRLDIACNNVGILGEIDPTFSVSETGWTNSMEANLTSAFFGAKYQIPEILKQGGGSIFFMATFVDRSFSLLGGAAYAAGNFGLIGLTRALAAEYGT
jgi:NAD(P)-dependent dehydrogenase (short-subunit alcohol dehydrogenase family)